MLVACSVAEVPEVEKAENAEVTTDGRREERPGFGGGKARAEGCAEVTTSAEEAGLLQTVWTFLR